MGLRDDILAQAHARSGLTYQLDPPPNGTTTTDCSLLVRDSVRAAGAGELPRRAEAQRQATILIPWQDAKPADLIFYEHTYDAAGPAGPDGKIASHVGFSMGAGTLRMFDAHERDGNDVALTDISTDYWQSKFLEVRRLPSLMTVDDGAGAPTSIPIDQMPVGIDVSSNNAHPIDWQAVKASGVSFAAVKVTEDDSYVNPFFEADWKGAKQAGLIRIAYHFAQPEGNDAEDEATWMLDHIAAHGGFTDGDLLALDMETGDGNLGPWTLTCVQSLERQSGIIPCIYTGKWFSDPHGLGSQPELARNPLWLAAYQATMPLPPAPWKSVSIWQYADTGRVPGVKGDVDMNRFNGSLDQLRALGLNGGAPHAPDTYVVGDGVRALMTQHGDVPGSNELYNDFWSETMATSGAIYRWLKSTGETFRYPPEQ